MSKMRKKLPRGTLSKLCDKNFQQGQAEYKAFRPRPPIPSDIGANEPEAWVFYGWMMARAYDVERIIADLRNAFGLTDSKEYNKVLAKRVNALDRAHTPGGEKLAIVT